MSIETSKVVIQKKAALRKQFLAYRSGLSPTMYATLSAAIVAHAQSVPELIEAQTVHIYWPLTSSGEVDVRPLIDWLQTSGKQIVLPIVDTYTNGPTAVPRLRHACFESGETLHPNRWGVHEPLGGKSVPIEAIDVVVVPALGAGRNGHRLGYGKGYYDAFLQTLDVPTICPVFDACLVERMPTQTHDIPLTVLITENEIIRP